MRTRLLVVTVVFVVAILVFSGIVLLSPNSPSKKQTPSPSSPVRPAAVGIGGTTWTNCITVSSCASAAISVSRYSTMIVVLAVDSSANPTSVTAHTGTLTLQRGKASGTGLSVAIYATENLSAADSAYTVTIAYAASHTYAFGIYEATDSRIASVDVVGTGSANTGSTQASDAATTTVANDLVFLAAGTSTNTSATATGGDAVLTTQHAAAITGVAADQLDTSTGSFTEAVNWGGTVRWCAIVIAIEPASVPAAPTGLTVGAVTTTTVPLTWNHAAGTGPITASTVYQATYSAGTCGAFSTTYSPGTVRTYTVTGLTSGTAYCFHVTWSNTTGEGAASSDVTNVQTANAPSAATGLAGVAQATSTSGITWTWSIPAQDTGITNVSVISDTSCHATWSGFTSFFSMGGSVLTYTEGGLSASTTYCAAIELWNATGGSSLSATATATTNGLPAASTGLGSTGATATTVGLAYTLPGGTISNVTIEYGTACGTWTRISTGGSASAFTVTGLSPFTRYCFTTRIWSPGGGGPIETPFLNVTTLANPPGVPTNLTATPTITSASFHWVNPVPNSGSIVNDTVEVSLFVSSACGTSPTPFSTTGAATTFTDSPLSGSTIYCVRVEAWTQAGTGGFTSYLQFTTLDATPAAPTGLVFVSSSTTSVTVSWTNPAGTLTNLTPEIGPAGCGGTQVDVNNAGVTHNWTFNGLAVATTFCVKVSAWTSGGEGPHTSGIAAATRGAIPAKPLNLTLTSSGHTYANIAWTNPAGYTLFNDSVNLTAANGTCGTWATRISLNGVASAKNLTGLQPQTTYCVVVVAWDNSSPPSDPLTFTTGANSSLRGVPGNGELTGGVLDLVGLYALVMLLVILVSRRRKKGSG